MIGIISNTLFDNIIVAGLSCNLTVQLSNELPTLTRYGNITGIMEVDIITINKMDNDSGIYMLIGFAVAHILVQGYLLS